MPLSKNKPAKAKAKRELVRSSSDTDKLPRNAQKNALGAGAKAQAAIKKDVIKKRVQASANEKLATSRGLGPDDGSGYSAASKAGAVAKKAGVPAKSVFVPGGSSAQKTVAKRVKQSMAARPEQKGKYKP